MIIDFHTHAFPEKIAANAVAKLSFTSGGMKPQTDGTIASLKEEMKKDGVDISVVQCIATSPKQQTNVNNFAVEISKDPAIVGFGSVHPDAPDALDELERIKAAGLKGVKFHPEYQSFCVDDERMKPIYKKVSQLGLVSLFHAGQDYGYPPPYRCMPDAMRRALKWFDSPVIAAHWGAAGFGIEVMDKLCGENIYFDLSFGYCAMSKCIAQAIVDKHGTDRLVFASDMPWHRPKWEMRLIDTLDLSESDRDKIFYKNAQHLLKL